MSKPYGVLKTRLKLQNEKRWIELCKTKDIMEQQGATPEAWRAMAQEFAAAGSRLGVMADYCERMANARS